MNSFDKIQHNEFFSTGTYQLCCVAWLLQTGWLQADVQAHFSNRNTTCALITQAQVHTQLTTWPGQGRWRWHYRKSAVWIKEASLIYYQLYIGSYTPLTTQGNQFIRDVNARPWATESVYIQPRTSWARTWRGCHREENDKKKIS